MNIFAYVHLRNIYRSTGAGRVARALTEQLATQPRTQLRILADEGDHGRIVGKVGAPWDRFRYHFLPRETSSQQARWIFLNRPGAEHFWPEADVVFCTAESYVPTRKARLAVTMHDAAYFEPDAHRRDAAYWKQRVKWRVLYERLLRSADLFHTVSQFSADRLQHFFPGMAKRIRVVHNAVGDAYFEPATTEGQDALDAAGLRDQPYILLPGGLHYRKNAELVFKAWPLFHEKQPDVKLVIANHSDPFYADQAAQLGRSVQMVGYVEDEMLRSLYAEAQIVWFPSRYEGFGLPILEAMACKSPVVASDSTSLPEVAGDAAVLVPADCPEKHAEALEFLFRDSATRRDLSERGRARAETFRWSVAGAKLRACFEELA